MSFLSPLHILQKDTLGFLETSHFPARRLELAKEKNANFRLCERDNSISVLATRGSCNILSLQLDPNPRGGSSYVAKEELVGPLYLFRGSWGGLEPWAWA